MKFFFSFILFFFFFLYPQKITNKKVNDKIIQKAKSFIGYKAKKIKVKNKNFNYDCSGLVAASYYYSGIDLFQLIKGSNNKNITVALYKRLQKKIIKNKNHLPSKGDLIFFKNTYDRNGNGKWDDGITHVGIVSKIDKDGTIHFIHLIRKGIVEQRLNLNLPKKYSYKGKKINDFLRRRPKSDNRRWRYLASNFFAGFVKIIQ